MRIDLKQPFACEKLLTSSIYKLFPNTSFDFSAGGEAILLSAGDEISEDHLGGEGSFEHFNIYYGQMLLTYGYDLSEVDLQVFLIAKSEMDEAYCICFLDSDGNVVNVIRDFDIDLA
ncbi:hypothetical protein D3C74_200650 [compost metagenome]